MLARMGLSVLLADRCQFPRGKVCGCCVNGAALTALNSAGLGSLSRDAGALPITGMLLAAKGRLAMIDPGRGVVLSREAFDAALVRAAVAAGVAFLPGVNVSLAGMVDDARLLLFATGRSMETVRARVVVAADGLGSSLLARAGAAPPLLRARSRVGAGTVVRDPPDFYKAGVIYMACGERGYVGLVRLEDGRLDLAAALDVAGVRAEHGPGAVVARVLSDTGWPIPRDLAALKWKGTPPLTRQPGQIAGARLFAIGDAAGYVEPFTGEGIARALATGLAVAPIAARATRHWQASLAREWSQTYRRLRGHRQLACRLAATVLRRPWLAGACVQVLARAPALATPIVRRLSAPVSLTPGPL
jgi:flavin-dependent dehydrogenase